MSFDFGTTLFSNLQSKITINNVTNISQIISGNEQLSSNMSSNGKYRIPGKNDIICNRSICGKDDQPTWQFCF